MEFNECDEISPIREESSRGIIRHTDSRMIQANVKWVIFYLYILELLL